MKRPRLPSWAGDFALFVALLLGTFLLLSVVSSATAPGIREKQLLQAARTLGQWLDGAPSIASLLETSSRDVAFVAVGARPALPALLSGAVWRVASLHHHWLLETYALRSGFLLLQSLAIPLLYLVLQPFRGRPAALIACALALFVPRSLHVLATASLDALAVVAWLLVLTGYVRCVRSGSIRWPLVTAALFGFALSISPAVAWLVVVLVLHTLWIRRRELRQSAREGMLPVPSATLPALVIAPITFLATMPWLWRETTVRGRQFALSALAPSVSPTSYAGTLVSAPPFPRSHALRELSASLPTITVVLAGAGLAMIAWSWWRARRANPDRSGLAALVVLCLLFAVSWPAIAPAALAVYPPRWILAVPFAAALAAEGAMTALSMASNLTASRSVRVRRALLASGLALVIGTIALQSVRSPLTLGAAFAPLFGGPTAMRESRTLAVHDASMAAGLADALDALGRPSVSLHAPEIGPDLWDSLRSAGRLHTQIRVVPNARDADLLVVGGPAGDALVRSVWGRSGTPPQLLSTVERDGELLLALYRVR